MKLFRIWICFLQSYVDHDELRLLILLCDHATYKMVLTPEEDDARECNERVQRRRTYIGIVLIEINMQPSCEKRIR